MEVQGRILEVFPARSGVSQRSGKEWATQDYLIEIPGQYPKKILFNVFGAENIKNFGIKKGEEVIVQFDIDAKEYNGRWYNDIRAYNIGRPQVQQATTRSIPQPVPPTPPLFPAEESQNDNADDLPF